MYKPQNMDQYHTNGRGLMSMFSYVSSDDSLADVTGAAGYFDESRFRHTTGWPGSWIMAKLTDGHFVLVVDEDGRTVKKL